MRPGPARGAGLVNFRAGLGETCAQRQSCSLLPPAPIAAAPGSVLQEAEPQGLQQLAPGHPQAGLWAGVGSADLAVRTHHSASVVWAGWFTAPASRAWPLSRGRLLVTPWTGARQAPLSVGFFRQEYWSRLPFLPSGDLPDLRFEP